MAHDRHFTEISNCDPQGNAGGRCACVLNRRRQVLENGRVITLVPEIQLESAPAVKMFWGLYGAIAVAKDAKKLSDTFWSIWTSS